MVYAVVVHALSPAKRPPVPYAQFFSGEGNDGNRDARAAALAAAAAADHAAAAAEAAADGAQPAALLRLRGSLALPGGALMGAPASAVWQRVGDCCVTLVLGSRDSRELAAALVAQCAAAVGDLLGEPQELAERPEALRAALALLPQGSLLPLTRALSIELGDS